MSGKNVIPSEVEYKALVEVANERSQLLDMIFEMSADILGVINFEGYFEQVSPSYTTVTGKRVEDFLAHPFMVTIHPDDVERTTEAFISATNGKTLSNFEVRCAHADGSWVWTSWMVTPLVDQNKMIAVGRDITQERLNDERLRHAQKMEAIGQLTGGIAHDFNNLLMGITGSLDLMGRKLPPECLNDVKRYMEGAQSSAKRAAALTHRLLAFSRRQPLAPTTVNVNKLVDGMHDLIERTIGSQIEVVTQLRPDVFAAICDQNQLESALLNLILNSRDAMPEGGTIIVKTGNITPEMCSVRGIPAGEYVKIAVQDSGCGMDEETKAKAFDPFFTTKPIGQGTGLGLSMLYGFVHQSGGHVRIDSSPDGGTSVMLYLPKAKNAVIADQAEEEKPAAVVPPRTNQNILLVEDESVIRALLSDVLGSNGYNVSDAANANEALKFIDDTETTIDLLVTDVGLPGINGKQLAEMARKIRPDLKVLFITGYAAGITLRQELLLGGSDMLLKPFTMDALRAKVAEMLDDQEVVHKTNVN